MDVELSAWEDILPDFGEVDKLLEELLPQENVNSMSFIEDVLKGNWVLEPDLLWQYIKEALLGSVSERKSLFISILVLFIASAVVNGLMTAFKNEGAAHTAKTFFVLCELIVLVNAFKEILSIVNVAMDAMLEFLKLMLPSYMICIAASGSGLTALIFYKLLLGFLCLLEGIVAAALAPVAEGYVLLGAVECIWDEGRFKGIMELMRKIVYGVIKAMVALLTGSGILQLTMTPVIDKTNTTIINKTAGAIPAIGDIVESVSSVTLASAAAVKNSVGVLILAVLLLIAAAPIMRAFTIIAIIKLGGALGSICGDRQMVRCIDCVSEAGFMLLRMLITVAMLFFLAIAAVTNAT